MQVRIEIQEDRPGEADKVLHAFSLNGGKSSVKVNDVEVTDLILMSQSFHDYKFSNGTRSIELRFVK